MVLVNKFIDLNSACLCLCMTGGLGSGVDGRRDSGVFKGGGHWAMAPQRLFGALMSSQKAPNRILLLFDSQENH